MELRAMRRNSWLFGLLSLSMLVWSPYDAAADRQKDESGKDNCGVS